MKIVKTQAHYNLDLQVPPQKVFGLSKPQTPSQKVLGGLGIYYTIAILTIFSNVLAGMQSSSRSWCLRVTETETLYHLPHPAQLHMSTVSAIQTSLYPDCAACRPRIARSTREGTRGPASSNETPLPVDRCPVYRYRTASDPKNSYTCP